MTIERMYVFDLDGVVTDPKTNRVNTDVLRYVAQDLSQGRAVAFNTGRSYEWVNEHVLAHFPKVRKLDNLLLVTEMGGVLGTFRGNELHAAVDPTLSLPKAFARDVVHLLDGQAPGKGRLADYLCWEGTKQTMGTLTKWDHVALDDFDRLRPFVVPQLEQLMQKYHLDEFVIGQTTVAIDVQHRSAGKHKGAKQIMTWLHSRHYHPQAFYTFGDSVSDKAMAEEFATSGTPTTFVFVGNPAHAPEVTDPAYTTVVTGGGHSSDTAVYLAAIDTPQ